MSIEPVMPSNHLILCHPLLLLPSIFPRIRIFSSKSALHIRWPKNWSFSISISPSNEYSGLISYRLTGLISLQSNRLSRLFSSTTVSKHQFFSAQLSLWSNSHIHTWKWKWSCWVVSDSVTPWSIAYQAPRSMGFSRQEYWSGVPLPSPIVGIRVCKK